MVVGGLYVSFLLVPLAISGISFTQVVAHLEPGGDRELWVVPLAIAVLGLPIIVAMSWLHTGGYRKPYAWALSAILVGVWLLGSGSILPWVSAGPAAPEIDLGSSSGVCAILAVCSTAVAGVATWMLLSCWELGATDVVFRLGGRLNLRSGFDSRYQPGCTVWLRLDRIDIRHSRAELGKAPVNWEPPEFRYIWFSEVIGIRAITAGGNDLAPSRVPHSRIGNEWITADGEYVELRTSSGREVAIPVADANKSAFRIHQRMSRAAVAGNS